MDDSPKIQERFKPAASNANIEDEQVIFICPGCNTSKDESDKKGCCNCRSICRKLTKRLKIFVLSGPGLTIVLLSYLMIGAVTFKMLEGGHKLDLRNFNISSKSSDPYGDIRIKEAVERLWKITENLNVLYKDNWTKLAGEEINNLQDYFYEKLTVRKDSMAVISECNTKNYHSNRKRNPPFWNLGECFLYSLSLLTTVGSGNILPRTIWGRVISIFYIMVGFFIMLIYLTVIGDCLASPFRKVYSYVSPTPEGRERKPMLKCAVPNCEKNKYIRHKQTSSTIPVWLTMIILIVYVTGGAFIFNSIEKWTLLDSWYFCFLSLVTIGFGDFTPGRMENISIIATSAYILIGMALLSMCFNLVQTDVIIFFRNLYIWSDREDGSQRVLPFERSSASSSS